MTALFLALVCGSARADEIASWTLLQDALLDEAVDGDVAGAASQYEMLVRTLAVDDPIRAEALYRLAQARFSAGNLDGAREALRDALSSASTTRDRCLDLLSELEVEGGGARAVPARFTFDAASPQGLVHPHNLADLGGVRLIPDAQNGSVLEWRTSADARGEDELVLGVAPGLHVRALRLRAMAPGAEARLMIVVVDDRGQLFGLPSVDLPAGTWTDVELPVDNTVDRFVFRRAAVAGESTLLIDDVEVL